MDPSFRGVPFGRRSAPKRGPYSMPIHSGRPRDERAAGVPCGPRGLAARLQRLPPAFAPRLAHPRRTCPPSARRACSRRPGTVRSFPDSGSGWMRRGGHVTLHQGVGRGPRQRNCCRQLSRSQVRRAQDVCWQPAHLAKGTRCASPLDPPGSWPRSGIEPALRHRNVPSFHLGQLPAAAPPCNKAAS